MAESIEVRMIPGDPVVVEVTGRIMYDTLRPLADTLGDLDPAADPHVVLQLSQAPMCDSSGLNLFVRTHSALVGAGGWLRLAAAPPMIEKVLDITNLDRILPVYRSVEEAAAAP
ncbi:STAS domain-containing protein [Dactylosporangium sp. CA-139066]|uniref:STAS domain-containing protein n=1 Tax=Dactylosporangium sp. CA-139066 TaxID=3239930 RepID=UPI003D94BFB6